MVIYKTVAVTGIKCPWKFDITFDITAETLKTVCRARLCDFANLQSVDIHLLVIKGAYWGVYASPFLTGKTLMLDTVIFISACSTLPDYNITNSTVGKADRLPRNTVEILYTELSLYKSSIVNLHDLSPLFFWLQKCNAINYRFIYSAT
jgi:hypothetical protein